METKSQRVDESKAEVTVTLSADEVDKQIAAIYKEAAKARIPGFRPGKAPRRVLENHYGGKEYFLARATDELVNTYSPLAVDQEGFVLIDTPEYSEIDLVQEGEEFTFSLSFTAPPEFELTSYGPVQIEMPSTLPSEEEIQAEIEGLQEYYVTFEDVTDRPAQLGDVVTVTFNPSKAEAEAADGSTEDVGQQDFELGCGIMPKDFDENVAGMAIGETKAFEITFDQQDEPEKADAEPVTTKVELRLDAIRLKIIPELTDEWVKETLEYEHGVGELRQRIAETLTSSKEEGMDQVREVKCSTELASRLVGEVPENLVKQTEQDNYKSFYRRLQENRVSFDQYLAGNSLTPEQFRDEMREQAVQNSRIVLALEAWARKAGIEVTDDELREEFAKAGLEDPEAAYQSWKAQGRLSEIRQGILRMKASRQLLETAEEFEPGTLKKEGAEGASGDKADEEAAKAAEPAADVADGAENEEGQ